MQPFPPPGYIATPSALEGVTLYRPAPPADEQQAVVAFRCPQCDGETAYNAADGGLTCTYCGHHTALPSAEGGRAETFEFTLDTVEQAAHGWGVERKELVCGRCGAHLVVEPQELTARCPFCMSDNVVQQKAAQDVLRPRFVIPFAIDPARCAQIAAQWLGSSWLTPRVLQRSAALGDFQPLFLPYWTFDARTAADWRAEVGHTRTVTRNGRQVSETVWRWESGRVAQTFANWPVAGSQRLSERLAAQVQPFDLSRLTPYAAEYLAGVQAVAYEGSLEAAWAQARAALREETRRACLQQASSGRVRNFSMTLDFQDEAWRYVLLPFYVSTYYYRNRPYQLVVNGQTGAIAGQRPADWRKIALVAALPLLAAALIVLFQLTAGMSDSQLPFLLAGGLFLLGVALALALGIMGAKLDDI